MNESLNENSCSSYGMQVRYCTLFQKSIFLVIFLLVVGAGISQEIEKEWFLSNYEKQEVYIPMRDGVKLYTAIYVPKDMTEKHPIVIE